MALSGDFILAANIGLQPTAARCDAEPPRLKPGVGPQV